MSSRRLGTPPPKSQRGSPVSSRGDGTQKISQADGAAAKSSQFDEMAAPVSSRRAEPDAEALFAEGRLDEALVAYKKQLLRLGSRRGPEHAQVFIGMARVKAAQGKPDEALQSYDKALGITPLDAALFDEAKALIAQGGDVARLAEWVRRRADAQQDPVARGRALVELGKIWLEHRDFHRAVTTLEAAAEADPSSSQASVHLADAFLGLERPAQAVRALARAGEIEQAPAARAAIWIRAAKLARDGLRGGEEVLELAGRALAADPQALAALELTSEVLASRRRYAELAEVYERALEASLEREDLPVRFEISKRLGLLYRDQLDDIDGAKRSFQRAIGADPGALELYYWQSELHEAEQRFVLAARQFQAAARHHADRPDVFRRALWLFEKAEDADAAWNAAVALESLGDADINESLLADQHRSGTALNAQRATRPERWRTVMLDAPGGSSLGRVFSAIEAAALAVLEARSQHARWLEGAVRQDPESTATLVRSLGWAARLLGVTAPELWIHSAPEVTLQLLPGAAPRRVVAPQRLGSGRDPRELGALWGYTLAGLVAPFSLVDAYVRDDLGRLLLSALALGGAEGVELEPIAQQLTDDLSEYMTDADHAALREAVAAVTVRELGGQLAAWRAQIVLGRYRLGLLLAGDLEALPNVLPDLAASGLPQEEILADLRGFSISEPYLALRQELGIEV
ncbi:MAG: tetratricopeptide repeat protein [Polyangiaceae bacterium]|nr:tetratricopeptide repeat protein [Polyangiaceae bacterium]